MAATLPVLLLFFLPLLLVTAAASEEKETHIRVYWYDVVSGPDLTVAHTAATNASKTLFGLDAVIDDPLTDGPGLNSSRLVGRAQGMYVSAGKDAVALLMDMVFVFQADPYNGSTVAIMGHNAVSDGVREMAVVSGTGAFSRARGYVQATTQEFDLKTGDAQYNLLITQL